MACEFFTIGHSNRTLEDFVELLRAAEIGLVEDIRKFPMSRSNPQFNKDRLADALAASQIAYEHLAALGGRRAKSRDVPPQVNDFWTNESFHNYADYALTPPFHAGLEHLLEQGRKRRCVIMCAEAVWWQCHRRIVTDHLIAHGESVVHIVGPGRLEPAQLTPGAVVRADRTVVYAAAQRSLL
ncbi:MAG TPA: DUF488 domain-containing protein [Burkholderiaceae bacterium]|nr:DUF488 domain-containing protein [Burkholderiaceae bacterium]